MQYHRYAPDPALSQIVEHYWSVEADAPTAPIQAVLVPNARATAQFCLGTPGTRTDPSTGLTARNADVLLPVTTTSYVLSQVGRSHYVGVQFTPWGAKHLWPEERPEPRPLTSLRGTTLEHSALLLDPAAALDRWLMPIADAAGAPSRLVPAAVGIVDSAPGDADVAGLCARLGTSPSTLQRAFAAHVGLSPKQYIDVMRYRDFTDTLLSPTEQDPVAFVAAMAGYYDQGHATRDFKRFTGMTPRAFRESLNGIAQLMRPGVGESTG